ncbi:hypothetical protein RI367_002682 [Sorochytrium milnesiophthora]
MSVPGVTARSSNPRDGIVCARAAPGPTTEQQPALGPRFRRPPTGVVPLAASCSSRESARASATSSRVSTRVPTRTSTPSIAAKSTIKRYDWSAEDLQCLLYARERCQQPKSRIWINVQAYLHDHFPDHNYLCNHVTTEQLSRKYSALKTSALKYYAASRAPARTSTALAKPVMYDEIFKLEAHWIEEQYRRQQEQQPADSDFDDNIYRKRSRGRPPCRKSKRVKLEYTDSEGGVHELFGLPGQGTSSGDESEYDWHVKREDDRNSSDSNCDDEDLTTDADGEDAGAVYLDWSESEQEAADADDEHDDADGMQAENSVPEPLPLPEKPRINQASNPLQHPSTLVQRSGPQVSTTPSLAPLAAPPVTVALQVPVPTYAKPYINLEVVRKTSDAATTTTPPPSAPAQPPANSAPEKQPATVSRDAATRTEAATPKVSAAAPAAAPPPPPPAVAASTCAKPPINAAPGASPAAPGRPAPRPQQRVKPASPLTSKQPVATPRTASPPPPTSATPSSAPSASSPDPTPCQDPNFVYNMSRLQASHQVVMSVLDIIKKRFDLPPDHPDNAPEAREISRMEREMLVKLVQSQHQE